MMNDDYGYDIIYSNKGISKFNKYNFVLHTILQLTKGLRKLFET